MTDSLPAPSMDAQAAHSHPVHSHPVQSQPAHLHPVQRQSLQVQIDAFLYDLQHHRARSQNTLLAYRADLVQFSRFMQESAPAASEASSAAGAALSEADLYGWQNALVTKGYAPATTARKLAAVASFATWLRANGYAAGVPERSAGNATAYPLPAAEVQAEEPVISPENLTALLAHARADDSSQGLRDCAMLQLICALGVRVGELAALNLLDYFARDRRLAIGADKRRRVVSLPSAVADAFAAYLFDGRPHLLVDPDESALFLNHRGKRLTRQGIWLIVGRHAQSAGIGAEATPQSLRRAWIQGEILRGLEAKEYAARVGTSSRRSARDYRRAARQLAPSSAIIIDGKPYTP